MDQGWLDRQAVLTAAKAPLPVDPARTAILARIENAKKPIAPPESLVQLRRDEFAGTGAVGQQRGDLHSCSRPK